MRIAVTSYSQQSESPTKFDLDPHLQTVDTLTPRVLGSGSMAGAEEPKVRPLLSFSDPWELRTRPFAFESATRSDAANPLGLNHLRDMTGQRNSACVRETSKLTCSPETREWCGPPVTRQRGRNPLRCSMCMHASPALFTGRGSAACALHACTCAGMHPVLYAPNPTPSPGSASTCRTLTTSYRRRAAAQTWRLNGQARESKSPLTMLKGGACPFASAPALLKLGWSPSNLLHGSLRPRVGATAAPRCSEAWRRRRCRPAAPLRVRRRPQADCGATDPKSSPDRPRPPCCAQAVGALFQNGTHRRHREGARHGAAPASAPCCLAPGPRACDAGRLAAGAAPCSPDEDRRRRDAPFCINTSLWPFAPWKGRPRSSNKCPSPPYSPCSPGHILVWRPSAGAGAPTAGGCAGPDARHAGGGAVLGRGLGQRPDRAAPVPQGAPSLRGPPSIGMSLCLCSSRGLPGVLNAAEPVPPTRGLPTAAAPRWPSADPRAAPLAFAGRPQRGTRAPRRSQRSPRCCGRCARLAGPVLCALCTWALLYRPARAGVRNRLRFAAAACPSAPHPNSSPMTAVHFPDTCWRAPAHARVQAAGVFGALSERLLPAITGLKSDRSAGLPWGGGGP
jgi:hypothetical protein